MPLRSLVSSIVVAGLAAVLLLTAPTNAQAQSLIDFLWGGSQEWGGGRQTVSFNPKYTPGQIIVSFGDRRLYHVTAKGHATSYPIAVPREQSRWQGTTTVSDKRVSPSWRPTPDMLRENPKLPSWVPGGHPMNPLGVRAMYLGASTYRIHGTDAPWTIGQAVSKGCIRMYNEDVLDLYPRVSVGTRVTVTWERFSTQSVASTSYGGPSSYNEVPHPFQPAAYKASPSRRTIRNLPPLPQSVREAQTAAVRMDAAKSPSGEKTEKADKAEKTGKPGKPTSEKAEKPAKVTTASRSSDSEPTASLDAKPDADKTPSAAATQGAQSAVEAARKAAAAAAKAAEAAQKAAEAAKKAAEDAKKATDAAKDPEKTAAKSAAL
jgi:lipoprotein-anchoring transpeptidase ErfK/SrfK